jgi:hypothetical protein
MDVPKLGREFVRNSVSLLRNEDTRSLEGFLGALFLLMGASQIAHFPFVGIGLFAGGLFMVYGASLSVLRARMFGCQLAAAVWFVLCTVAWTGPGWMMRMLTVFMAGSLAWIYWRLGSLLPGGEHGRRGDELDSGNNRGPAKPPVSRMVENAGRGT